MKILLVGQFKKWALENHFAKYLGQHAEVSTYAAEDVFDDFYWSSTLNKLKFKLGLSAIYETIARELIEKVKRERPDVVWVFKGMRVLPKVLRQLREMGVQLVNYNPDHPFLFSTDGSGNRHVTDSIGLYDLHFCYSHSVQERIEREFGIPTAFLPFAFELSEDEFEQVELEPEVNAACFIGNPDGIRVAHVKALAQAGIEVFVYGNQWGKHLSSNQNVHLHGAVYGLDFWRKMRAYRLQINVFRPHNEGSHNMRTFEVPAVGGIMLAPESPEHREFFESGKEIFTYENMGDLVEKAEWILGMPAEEAAGVRRQAREKSLQAGYTYENRARQVTEALYRTLAVSSNRNQGSGIDTSSIR